MYYKDYGYHTTQADIDEIVRIKKKINDEGWSSLTLEEQERYLGVDNARKFSLPTNRVGGFHVNGCLNVYDLNRWSWYLGRVGKYYNSGLSDLEDVASELGVAISGIIPFEDKTIRAGYLFRNVDSSLTHSFLVDDAPYIHGSIYGLEDLSHDLMVLMSIRGYGLETLKYDDKSDMLFKNIGIDTINEIERCMSGEYDINLMGDLSLFDDVLLKILSVSKTFESAGELYA